MEISIDEAENYLIALKHCETCEANDTNICKACPHYRRGSSAKCYDAIDVAIDTMRKYKKNDKWIKVSDKLPNSGELVLAYHTYDDPFHSDQHIIISRFELQDYWMDGTITHWMPFPEPPEMFP